MTCNTENCTNPATQSDGALTVFEETLTESGLATIKEQAANLPAIAKTQTEYKEVYEFNTRMKRLSVAVRKKEKSIQSDLRADYNNNRDKIKRDLDYVMGVINPLIESTIKAREYIEAEAEAWKENKARTAAAAQRAEFERLEAERVRQSAEQERIRQEEADRQAAELAAQKEEAARQAEAARIEREALKAEQDRLAAEEAEAQRYIEEQRAQIERERYEFECEKSRLSYDDAYNEAYPDYTEPKICVIGNHDDHIKAIETLKEFSQPAEPIGQTETFADVLPDLAPAEPVTTTVQIGGKIIDVEPTDTTEDIQKKVDEAMPQMPAHNVTISATIDTDQQTQPEQIDTPVADCDMIDPENEIQEQLNRSGFDLNACDVIRAEPDIDPDDKVSIEVVSEELNRFLFIANGSLETGFESASITDATYRMIQTITKARDEWVTAVNINGD